MARSHRVYTLTEVSERTGISMPTLQRYKKLYQSRIPSVGKGRKQRYPREAFAVLEKIKGENLKKRGRPPKKGGTKRAKRKAKTSAKSEANLTLLEIGRRTGISYPTLLRYVKLHGNKIPHEGSGRKRRYPPEAVKVFAKIRASSKRGPKSRGPLGSGRAAYGVDPALARRIRELERAQRDISRQLDQVIKLLRKPLKITVASD